MQKIISLIEESHQWLIDRSIAYAKTNGYTTKTSKLERAWRLSIEGLAKSINIFLAQTNAIKAALAVNENQDITLFAKRQAQKHRSMGIPIEMFLGLMKCYRRSFLDLVRQADLAFETKSSTMECLSHFFDQLEIDFCKEWFNLSAPQAIEELQVSNRAIVLAKNKYQTLFESMHNPIFILDSELGIIDCNVEAIKLSEEIEALPWLQRELTEFINAGQEQANYEKQISVGAGIRIFKILIRRLRDITEQNSGLVVILTDVTGARKTGNSLRRRLELERTIKKISARFIGVYDLNEAINASLADVGNILQVSRSYIFAFRKKQTFMDNTHEWCTEGVTSRQGELQNLATSLFPWWMEQIGRNEIIQIPNLTLLPEEAISERKILQNQGVKSLLAFPLYVKGVPYGFVGLDHMHETNYWNQDDLALLNMVAEIIANAFERKVYDEILKESEASYRTIFENTGTATIIADQTEVIILANDEFCRLTGLTRSQIEGKKSWTEFFSKIELKKIIAYHFTRRKTHRALPNHHEADFNNRLGEVKRVLVQVAMLPGENKRVISFTDITPRIKAEQKLKYLSYHDALTGLYNRTFFEEEISRLEGTKQPDIGIIICDLDGLKLINDTLGHQMGDEMLVVAAYLLKGCMRQGDVLARIGGDEFAILILDGNYSILEKISARINQAVWAHNQGASKFDFNISVGFALRRGVEKTLTDVFKEADDNMYREKLHHNQSNRSHTVNLLSKALEARDFVTGGHAERLEEYVVSLAMAVGVKESKLGDLKLFAKFHDVGKVGISDRILFKSTALTEEEKVEMCRHSEIGYRIAKTSPDLAPIADWILKHHEWWNGQGYPLGLSGPEIPLECRILAIADAYDAMTSDRPYRKATCPERALAELKANSGSQFDPALVEIFVEHYGLNKAAEQINDKHLAKFEGIKDIVWNESNILVKRG